MTCLCASRLLVVSLSLAVALNLASVAGGQAADVRGKTGLRPNIVFVLCDDLGWADLPCYGRREKVFHAGGTPVRNEFRLQNIDRLAAEGTRFNHFYTNAAVCSPSRAGLLTGRFPGALGIHDFMASPELNRERGMPEALDPAFPTLPKLLRAAGYRTAVFGKWHLGPVDDLSEYGFDAWHCVKPEPEARPNDTAALLDRTLAFIKEDPVRPFFVNLWIRDPHTPLHPTPEQLAPYRHLAPEWGDEVGSMQVWYGVLGEIDRQIGRLLDELERLGLSGRTIVIFTSDNGAENALYPATSHFLGASSAMDSPFRGAKRSLYEGGVRMPFLLRWPGRTPAGGLDEQTAFSAVDLLPTLADAAGVSIPADWPLDGESVLPAFEGRPVEKKKPILWENRFPVYGHVVHKSPMLAVRDGKWKLLMNPDRSRIELYDVAADPAELKELSSAYPEETRRLADKVLHWSKELPDGPVHPDAGSAAW